MSCVLSCVIHWWRNEYQLSLWRWERHDIVGWPFFLLLACTGGTSQEENVIACTAPPKRRHFVQHRALWRSTFEEHLPQSSTLAQLLNHPGTTTTHTHQQKLNIYNARHCTLIPPPGIPLRGLCCREHQPLPCMVATRVRLFYAGDNNECRTCDSIRTLEDRGLLDLLILTRSYHSQLFYLHFVGIGFCPEALTPKWFQFKICMKEWMISPTVRTKPFWLSTSQR